MPEPKGDKRDTQLKNNARGSAILAAMIMVAVFVAVLALAVEKNRPAKKRKELVAQAKERIQVLSEAVTTYYRNNGGFPTNLNTLIGKGRVDHRTLKDPFAKGKKLKYKILSQNPDVAILYSIGPNRKDDGGKRKDIRRRISGKRIGRAETKDRLRLIRRALIGKTGTGSSLGEAGLDQTRSMFLGLVDRFWAYYQRYTQMEWARRWAVLWGGISIYLAAYYGAYSYDLPSNGAPYYSNLRNFYKKPAPQLLVHSLLYSSVFSGFFWFNKTNDPSVVQADIDALKALGLSKAKENVYLSAMNFFKELTQHVANGGSSQDETGKALLENAFQTSRSTMITAMLSSQTGQDQTSSQDFLSRFEKMEGEGGLIQALGLPSKFAYDAWGTPFRIDKSGNTPKIKSAGPDRKPGTQDDHTLRRRGNRTRPQGR